VSITYAITIRCEDGAAGLFRSVLAEIAPPSRDEEGCEDFQVHESTEDENVFFVYERYVDEAAYEHHLTTPAFARVKDEVFPRVVERDVQTYRSLA